MPFDAGPPRPTPTPSEPPEIPIDWLDWALAMIFSGSLLVLWLVWAGTSIWNAIVQGFGIGGGS